MPGKEYVWKDGVYLPQEGGRKDETSSTSSASRGRDNKGSSADSPMAAFASLASSRNSESPTSGKHDSSEGQFSKRADGQRSVEHGGTARDGSNHGSSDAGAAPGIEPLFDEDRPLKVNFDDMLDLARRTRIKRYADNP